MARVADQERGQPRHGLSVAMLIAALCCPYPVIDPPAAASEIRSAAVLPAPGSERGLARPAAPPLASCPYDFRSDMPPGTFCVYRGVIIGGAGELCADDVVALWSSYAPTQLADARPGDPVPSRSVFIAFVGAADLVMRGVVEPGQGYRAHMVSYTLGEDEEPVPLVGETLLRSSGAAGAPSAILTVDIKDPASTAAGACAFGSFHGTFLGLIGNRH
jgi:hypothetical protein